MNFSDTHRDSIVTEVLPTFLQVPQDAAALRSNIYFCSSCNQYLPSTDFQLSSNSDTVGRCKRCLKMDNDSRVRQDYSHYRYMLKALRRSEENYGDDSKIAFLLQVRFRLSTSTKCTQILLHECSSRGSLVLTNLCYALDPFASFLEAGE